MATRHERVVVDLEDRFTTPAARMAASAGLLRKNLDDSGRGVIAFDRTVKSTSPSIDQLSGRVALLSRAAGALGPAFIPVTTAAVPALAGLSTQLGFAAAGAGTAVLAFNGVGDALEALNAYQLEPTDENLAKLQESMRGLGPAAREFVGFLDEIGPQLQSLREAAQEGLLPGVEEGLDALLGRLPQVRSIISEVAEASGDIVSGAGVSLAGSGWDQFFTFLEAEARPALMTLGETAGNVARGIAEVWMAMDPLSDDFTAGLLEASETFAQWADGMSQTEGYREFIDYVRETGPQVVETVGSVANSLLQIAEAAAPLGGPVLTGLELIADTVAVIADSPIGPPLMAAVTAMSALSLATKGWATVMESSAVGNVRGLTADLKTMGSTGVVAWGQSAAEAEKYNQAAGRVRSTLSSMGRSAGLVAGLAVASSGLGESMGVANTASLALMGTIAGPWGAAIGGAIGLALDLASANDDLESAAKAVDDAFSSQTVSMTRQSSVMADLQAKADAFTASVSRARSMEISWDAFLPDLGDLSDGWNNLNDVVTNAGTEMTQKARETSYEFGVMEHTINMAADALQLDDSSPRLLDMTVEQMDRFITDIAPAMQRAGLDVRTALESGDWESIAAAVRDYNTSLNSAAGRSTAVGDALAGLQDPMLSTADAATALKSAMDSLFGVQLSQSEATDAWIVGLQSLQDQIAETSGAIRGNSEAALGNREAIRGSVEALQAKIVADANANVSGDKLVETLLRGREAIINQAAAAGASKKEVRAYLDTLGLTPENLTTIISTPGVFDAKDQIKALTRLYGLTPKDVRTIIAQAGMGASQAEIKELARRYNLTPKQVRTIVEAVDNATGTLNYIQGQIAALDGRQARAYVTTYYNEVYNRNPIGGIQRASGGPVRGAGTATSDSIPAMLSNGEYVVRAAAVDRYGQAFFDAANAMRLASGGPVGFARGGKVTSKDRRDLAMDLRDFEVTVEMDLRDIRKELKSEIFDPIRDTLGNGSPFLSSAKAMSEGLLDSAAVLDRERRQREKMSEGLDEAREGLRGLRDAARSFRDEVSGNFLSDPFNKTVTVAGGERGGAEAFGRLIGSEENRARDMLKALQEAEDKGLDGPLFQALAAKGDLALAEDLAEMSRREIRRYEERYAERAQAAAQLAAFAGQEAYAGQISDQRALVADQRASLAEQNQLIRTQTKALREMSRHLPKEVGDAIVSGLKGAASGAQARGRNHPKGN